MEFAKRRVERRYEVLRNVMECAEFVNKPSIE